MSQEGRCFDLAIQVLDFILMPLEILFSSNGGKYTIILKLNREDFSSAVELVCEYMVDKGRKDFAEIFRKRASDHHIA